MIEFAHPALILILGGLLLPFFTGNARKVFLLAVPLLSLYNLTVIPHGDYFQTQFLGFDILPARIDSMSFVFGLIFNIITVVGVLFSLNDNNKIQSAAALIYAGGAQGVVFAGDFLTLFLFWESLTVSAATIIWSNRSRESQGAGYRYALVHAAGGLILLAGVVMRAHEVGSLDFGYVGLDYDSLSSILIFLGFGVNAAWPVLHAWLTDAYPAASPTGTVFLSAYTTKSAVYVLARAFPGAEELIWIGGVMAVFPLLYAAVENNLRRVLSYCLINQVGFMMVGVGIGTELAMNGVCAHAFSHILYKSLLFMSIGAVLFRTGTADCTDLGGLYKSMPWTCLFCIIGALGISTPYFCGFISKSMILSAAGKEHMTVAWFALMFASGAVFMLSGVKVVYYAFFGRDSGLRPSEAPGDMLAAMAAGSVLCIYIGSHTDALYSLLPYAVKYEPYTVSHVAAQAQLLLFSGLAFALLIRSGLYPAAIRSANMDADFLWRRGGKGFFNAMDVAMNGLNAACSRIFVKDMTGGVMRFFANAPLRIAMVLTAPFHGVGETKKDIRRIFSMGISPVGSGVLLATLFLFGFMLFMM